MAEEKIYNVPLEHIKSVERSGLNVRDVEIDELADSIKKHELLQPIILRGIPGKPKYDLIVGRRRLLAHIHLDETTIKARIKPPSYSDSHARIDSLVENLQRIKLNRADAAKAITDLYNKYNKNERKVAKELGLPLRTVRDYINIEEQASDYAKDLLRNRKVEKADVKRAIAAAQGNLKKADRLLDEMPKLYGHEKKRAVDYGREHPSASSNEIIQEAKKARIRKTIVLSIEPKIDKALIKAEKNLYLNREEIAYKALEGWLVESGFLAR